MNDETIPEGNLEEFDTMEIRSRRMITRTALLVSAVLSVGGIAIASTFDASTPVEKPAAQFKFDTITPFLKFSDAYGDRATGAHGTFGIIPGKTASPSHVHSAAYHGVVIKGVMTDGFNGEKNPPHLAPGSYWYVPANAVHITACISKEPCLFYTHSDAKFDFAPAEPKQ